MSVALNELEAMSRGRNRGEPNWGSLVLFAIIGSFAIPMSIAAMVNLAGVGQYNFALSAVWGIIDVWIGARFLSLWLGITAVDLVRHLFGRLMGWSKEENPALKVLPPILKFFVVWVWVKFLILGFLMSFLDIEDNWDLFAGAVITGMFLSLGLPFVAKDRFFDILFRFYWKWVLLWIMFVWFAITFFPALRPWGDDAAKVAYRTYVQAKRDLARNHASQLRAVQPKVNGLTAKGYTLQAAIATLPPKEQALFRYYQRSYLARWMANFHEEAWPNMKVAFGDAGEGFGLISPVDRLADEIRGGAAKQGQKKSLDCLADLKAKVDAGQAVTPEQIEGCQRLDPNYGKPATTKDGSPASTPKAKAEKKKSGEVAWEGNFQPGHTLSVTLPEGNFRVADTSGKYVWEEPTFQSSPVILDLDGRQVVQGGGVLNAPPPPSPGVSAFLMVGHPIGALAMKQEGSGTQYHAAYGRRCFPGGKIQFDVNLPPHPGNRHLSARPLRLRVEQC